MTRVLEHKTIDGVDCESLHLYPETDVGTGVKSGLLRCPTCGALAERTGGIIGHGDAWNPEA